MDPETPVDAKRVPWESGRVIRIPFFTILVPFGAPMRAPFDTLGDPQDQENAQMNPQSRFLKAFETGLQKSSENAPQADHPNPLL